jgi:hypothetical protein
MGLTAHAGAGPSSLLRSRPPAKLKAPVLVAKLDRLSRDVHFISGLADSMVVRRPNNVSGGALGHFPAGGDGNHKRAPLPVVRKLRKLD